jgi:hypothetical protein
VYIDKEFSWWVHIGKIITQISQTVGIIGQARRFMNGPQLFHLYNTMVLLHLQYCLIDIMGVILRVINFGVINFGVINFEGN